jgi:hypothetical protein
MTMLGCWTDAVVRSDLDIMRRQHQSMSTDANVATASAQIEFCQLCLVEEICHSFQLLKIPLGVSEITVQNFAAIDARHAFGNPRCQQTTEQAV